MKVRSLLIGQPRKHVIRPICSKCGALCPLNLLETGFTSRTKRPVSASRPGFMVQAVALAIKLAQEIATGLMLPPAGPELVP
jgi:hypothetical protein